MKKHIISLFAMVAVVVFAAQVLAGANQKEPEQTAPEQTAQPVVQNVPSTATLTVAVPRLSSIISDLQKHKGHSMTIAGQFGGWNHACPSSMGVTRSDWVLFDGGSCLFVTGAKPAGLSDIQPKNENVTVTALIKQAASGKYYLEASAVK